MNKYNNLLQLNNDIYFMDKFIDNKNIIINNNIDEIEEKMILGKILNPLYIKKLLYEYKFYNTNIILLFMDDKSNANYILNAYYKYLNEDNIFEDEEFIYSDSNKIININQNEFIYYNTVSTINEENINYDYINRIKEILENNKISYEFMTLKKEEENIILIVFKFFK